MFTALAIANVVLFTVAVMSALWSARNASPEFQALKRIKATLAAVYALGISIDLWWLTTDEWRILARWVGVVSIPLVWIAPDVLGRRWVERQAQRVDEAIRGG